MAVLAGLAGLAAGGCRIYSNLNELTKGMVQVVVPGEADLALEPGSYTAARRATKVKQLYRGVGT